MQNRGMIDARLPGNLLPAISRLEFRLAETEQQACACRTALSELRAVQPKAVRDRDCSL